MSPVQLKQYEQNQLNYLNEQGKEGSKVIHSGERTLLLVCCPAVTFAFRFYTFRHGYSPPSLRGKALLSGALPPASGSPVDSDYIVFYMILAAS